MLRMMREASTLGSKIRVNSAVFAGVPEGAGRAHRLCE